LLNLLEILRKIERQASKKMEQGGRQEASKQTSKPSKPQTPHPRLKGARKLQKRKIYAKP
jgi:hypothetical protein